MSVYIIPSLAKMPTKRVIIAGSRNYRGGVEGVARAVAESGFDIEVVLCGCARGADEAGVDWVKQHTKKRVDFYLPDWKEYGKCAGPIRNQQMADEADALIALMDMDNPTKGTSDMIRRMKDKPCCIYWEPAWD